MIFKINNIHSIKSIWNFSNYFSSLYLSFNTYNFLTISTHSFFLYPCKNYFSSSYSSSKSLLKLNIAISSNGFTVNKSYS